MRFGEAAQITLTLVGATGHFANGCSARSLALPRKPARNSGSALPVLPRQRVLQLGGIKDAVTFGMSCIYQLSACVQSPANV